MKITSALSAVSEWAAREYFRAKSERGITQTDLGRALGISQPQAARLLDGSRKVSANEIPVLEKFFNSPFIHQPLNPSVLVPLVSWVSAGELSAQEGVIDLSDYPTIEAVGLPAGDWIALRVDGASMNKISPPDSIIFVDLSDTRLVPNRPYVIADEAGQVTYKRYEPEKTPPFQPVTYKEDIKPPELRGAIKVVGRVKRSMIEM